ncbi:hypothetical protein EJ04DRAFT_514903 [Polyplosphaeria fusca]|uniref:Uncharacterized protein n=1 Tax=Polyplosphaeria fusca TaxID=682080 RepID=A0A9P4V085_9PLEO|nr:hypothetical protein EJ04DRAFT_514903 [Polyplosphaeria fusca]
MHIVAFLPLLLPAASAWTLVLANRVWDGTGNKGCTPATTPAGSTLDWDRAWLSDCCVHLYNDASCSSQVGYSCKDWKKTTSQRISTFKVTNC